MTRYIVGANSSNEISKEYYHTVKGMMNEGITKLIVTEINRKSHTTYHLISI